MKPVHVTFTGIDDDTSISDMVALARDYPIEWAICFHPGLVGLPRYPTFKKLNAFLAADLRFSAHLSGSYADRVLVTLSVCPEIEPILLRCNRIQVNTWHDNFEPRIVAEFMDRFGARAILQTRCPERFPRDNAVDWLFDRSRGTGRLPPRWPIPETTARFVGYSGGLGPHTLKSALHAISARQPREVPFWLDMESGVRFENKFDLTKCKEVCQLIFG